MDPNLFHVDWERTFEAVGLIVILAFVVERALVVIIETRWFIERFSTGPAKEILAVSISIVVCFYWQFDALSMIVLTEKTRPWGYVLTGLVIAGGSKGAVKLFHDLLNIKSSAQRDREEVRTVVRGAALEAAEAAATVAAADATEAGLQTAKEVVDRKRDVIERSVKARREAAVPPAVAAELAEARRIAAEAKARAEKAETEQAKRAGEAQ